MSLSQVHEEIARLDGYLAGIAASNGCIRNYSANAFLVESVEPEVDLERAITGLYPRRTEFVLGKGERLPRGFGSLERDIQPFLVRELASASSTSLTDLRRYLSFRVLDMLWYVVEVQLGVPQWSATEVWRLESEARPDSPDCVYFCIRLEGMLLVLEFRDDLKWLDAINSGRIDPLLV